MGYCDIENTFTCGDHPENQKESKGSIGEGGKTEEQPTHASEMSLLISLGKSSAKTSFKQSA